MDELKAALLRYETAASDMGVACMDYSEAERRLEDRPGDAALRAEAEALRARYDDLAPPAWAARKHLDAIEAKLDPREVAAFYAEYYGDRQAAA